MSRVSPLTAALSGAIIGQFLYTIVPASDLSLAFWRTDNGVPSLTDSVVNYDPVRRYDFKVEDVEYRRDGERSWLAQMYRPQGPGPFPALLDIHGGAWNNGVRKDNPAIAEGLAASRAMQGREI